MFGLVYSTLEWINHVQELVSQARERERERESSKTAGSVFCWKMCVPQL